MAGRPIGGKIWRHVLARACPGVAPRGQALAAGEKTIVADRPIDALGGAQAIRPRAPRRVAL